MARLAFRYFKHATMSILDDACILTIHDDFETTLSDLREQTNAN